MAVLLCHICLPITSSGHPVLNDLNSGKYQNILENYVILVRIRLLDPDNTGTYVPELPSVPQHLVTDFNAPAHLTMTEYLCNSGAAYNKLW